MIQKLKTLCFALLALCASAAQAQEEYTLLTNAYTLKEGDKIVIANKSAQVAMSTTQNSANRGQTAVSFDGDLLLSTPQVQVLVLEGTPGAWLLRADEGYLQASGNTSNQLKTVNTPDDNCRAAISADASGKAVIAFQGTNQRNLLRYNKQASIFSCYASGTSVSDDLQVYYQAGSTVPHAGLVRSIAAFNALDDHTTARLYLSDTPEARVIYTSADTTLVSDGTALLILTGVASNPGFRLHDHVAGYLTGMKERDAAGNPILVATSHTNTAFFLVARPVSETPTGMTLPRKRSNAERNAIYNMYGQYMGTNAKGLPGGIYIRDGKKIIIR